MSQCAECTEARRRPWAAYRVGCDGCGARMAARSHAAKLAWEQEPADPEPLRELLRRLLPLTDPHIAADLAHGWWRSDQAFHAATP